LSGASSTSPVITVCGASSTTPVQGSDYEVHRLSWSAQAWYGWHASTSPHRHSSDAAAQEPSKAQAKDHVHAINGEWIGPESTLEDVPVDRIVPSPYQPRLYFDPARLEELATSIQSMGLATPILVRPLPDGQLELVGGECRWRACQINGAATISAIIRPMSDAAAMLLALTSNVSEDLSDYEWGKSYSRILKDGQEVSIRALARRLGVNHSSVSRCLAMMQLPEAVRQVLDTSPQLITANYVKRFLDIATIDSDLVMKEEGLQQEAALRQLNRQITESKQSAQARPVSTSFKGIGAIKVVGQKIEFKCEKGVDAQRLRSQFEAFLRTVDQASVAGAEPE
jgi:ParB family chromosome partitioning protein